MVSNRKVRVRAKDLGTAAKKVAKMFPGHMFSIETDEEYEASKK